MKLFAISLADSFPSSPALCSPPHTSLDPLLNLVDPDSRERIRRFRHLVDARRCLLGSLLRRYVAQQALGVKWDDTSFSQTDKGRPFVAHPTGTSFDFNLAHDGACIVLASVDGVEEGKRVGVDVMELRNPWEGETVRGFADGLREQLTPYEDKWINESGLEEEAQLRRILTLWTLKEAYLKALGAGLTLALNTIEFRLRAWGDDANGWIADCWRDGASSSGWSFGLSEWRGHLLAWAVEGATHAPTPTIELVTLDQILQTTRLVQGD